MIGPYYCSFGAPNLHTRIVVETMIPKSEPYLLSSLFRQDLLASLGCTPPNVLKILIVASVQNKICAFPIDLPSQCIVLTTNNVETIRAGDRFWGTATPPSTTTSLCLMHETEIAIIDVVEPLAWLIEGITTTI